MNFSTNPPKIPVFKPLIEEAEISASVESLKLGWLGMGSYVKQFEEQVATVCELDALSDRHVVAVSTGHAAIHLSLLMMGVGPGDEVITPSFNNAADFQAILACGAEPVFVDIRKDTLCIDATQVESLITERTKCIIAMDYDIFICDHDRLAEIAKRHGIPVLHDAAHSFGSYYKGKPTGNQHAYTIFSFDPVKTITCIDGGVIVIQGKESVRRLQAKRLIGMTQPAEQMYNNSRAWAYDIEELGFRYHMANLHAAIGCAQLKKMKAISESRQAACLHYSISLSKIEQIHAPNTDFKSITPFLYYILVPPTDRGHLRKHLLSCGIDTGIHWQPGHTFTLFQNCRKGNLDVTEYVSQRVLSLPLHSMMSLETVDYISGSISEYFEASK